MLQCYMLNVFFGGVGVKIYLHKHCQPVRSQAQMAWLEMEKVFFSKGPGTFVWKTSWVYISSQSARLIVWFSAFFLLHSFFSLGLISFPFVSPSVSSNSDCYFVLLVLPFFFCLLMCLRVCLASNSDAFVCLILFWLFDFFFVILSFVFLSWFFCFQVYSFFSVCERVLQQWCICLFVSFFDFLSFVVILYFCLFAFISLLSSFLQLLCLRACLATVMDGAGRRRKPS